jgi:hypothetical protein
LFAAQERIQYRKYNKPYLFSLNKFDIHALSLCVVVLLVNTIFIHIYAQSEGLKVIVSNERESGTVCVSSRAETLGCKYVNLGDSEEFQFSPNAVQVEEEFQVCLDALCKTDRNSQENIPEHVDFGSEEVDDRIQSNSANQQQETAGSGAASGLVKSLLLVAVAAAIGMGIWKLSRRKKQGERHGFSDIVKERILKKQNHRCAHCNRLLNVVDWDHKNGKRNDDSESNCQALCPNCHAVKTHSKNRFQ